MTALEELCDSSAAHVPGGFAYLDENSKRELRRTILTAIAVPGYQVPFGSREMPVARGWGSGGLQITLSMVGPDDVVKVYDQGEDAGVNAANLRRFIVETTGVEVTTVATEATIIQSRHRIPQDQLESTQTLVLQVPVPEPLRAVERDMVEMRRMHAEGDYARMWVNLYEDVVRHGVITHTTGYPCLVAGRYVIATTPIPRWDVPKLHQARHTTIFGAGREKRIYAVPPHTDVEPLTFDDVPFAVETTPGARCAACGAQDSFLVELAAHAGNARRPRWLCSDTDWCRRRREAASEQTADGGPAP